MKEVLLSRERDALMAERERVTHEMGLKAAKCVAETLGEVAGKVVEYEDVDLETVVANVKDCITLKFNDREQAKVKSVKLECIKDHEGKMKQLVDRYESEITAIKEDFASHSQKERKKWTTELQLAEDYIREQSSKLEESMDQNSKLLKNVQESCRKAEFRGAYHLANSILQPIKNPGIVELLQEELVPLRSPSARSELDSACANFVQGLHTWMRAKDEAAFKSPYPPIVSILNFFSYFMRLIYLGLLLFFLLIDAH